MRVHTFNRESVVNKPKQAASPRSFYDDCLDVGFEDIGCSTDYRVAPDVVAHFGRLGAGVYDRGLAALTGVAPDYAEQPLLERA